MSEVTKNDIPPNTPANPEGFEPLNLPADLKGKVVAGLPQEEVRSAIDMKFDAAYISLQKAVERGDPSGYVKGLGDLSQLMGDEVTEHHGQKFGDLNHTFMEWRRQGPYFTADDGDKIKAGADVSKLSNTLDNQFKPHRDWDYRDHTMSKNSEHFGTAVADYLNQRGNGFITGAIVPGETDQQSVFMVQTILKGFPKAPVAK